LAVPRCTSEMKMERKWNVALVSSSVDSLFTPCTGRLPWPHSFRGGYDTRVSVA
jgi:hypothetical protein